MLLIYQGIDALLQILLLLLVFVARMAYKRADNNFMVDTGFMKLLLTEYVSVTAFTLIVGTLLAIVMKRNRYFVYKYEGMTTSSAYRDMPGQSSPYRAAAAVFFSSELA